MHPLHKSANFTDLVTDLYFYLANSFTESMANSFTESMANSKMSCNFGKNQFWSESKSDKFCLNFMISVTTHIVWGSILWFSSHWWRFDACSLKFLDQLGGVYLHEAPSLHSIISYCMEIFGWRSFTSLWLGWILCLLLGDLLTSACLVDHPLGIPFDDYGACYLIMVLYWYTYWFIYDGSSPPRIGH